MKVVESLEPKSVVRVVYIWECRRGEWRDALVD